VLPLLIGVPFVILLIPTALRHTSYLAEKAVVIVTGFLLAQCTIGYVHTLGVQWAVFPYGDPIFVIISWLVVILAGVLTLQMLRGDHVTSEKRDS
jgi:hypothetical protein